MPAWDAEVIDAYMDGNQFPTWEFVTNVLDVVASDNPWRRETLERRVRPVWQATARRQSLGPSMTAVAVSDSIELSASGKWFTAVRQVSQAGQVLSLVQRSVDRHRVLEAALAEMLHRLSEAVISLTNERDRLRAELDALQIDDEDGGTSQRAYVESDDLRHQLRDTQERLLVAERIREATSQRLEESERQRLLAERLRDEALEQAERARRRLAELEGRPTALPRATVNRDSAEDSQSILMGDDDQRIAEEVLRQIDEVLRDEAEALDQLEDKLAAGPRPQLVLSYQEPAAANRNVLEPTPREDASNGPIPSTTIRGNSIIPALRPVDRSK